MKRFVPLKTFAVRIVSAIIFMLLVVSLQSHAICSEAHKSFASHYFDSIVVEKQFSSKKYKIKLYPNANQQVLFFSASGESGRVYQFFLFDMDGTLIKQANIRNKQTTVINNLDKGVYLFEVFSDDERIETGKVTVR
jgi:hypothetical protein